MSTKHGFKIGQEVRCLTECNYHGIRNTLLTPWGKSRHYKIYEILEIDNNDYTAKIALGKNTTWVKMSDIAPLKVHHKIMGSFYSATKTPLMWLNRVASPYKKYIRFVVVVVLLDLLLFKGRALLMLRKTLNDTIDRAIQKIGE